MNREQKSQIVDRLSGALAEVPAVVVAGFSGLTVEATDSLRSEMRAAGVSFEDRQDLLGHRSGRITTHYSGLILEVMSIVKHILNQN